MSINLKGTAIKNIDDVIFTLFVVIVWFYFACQVFLINIDIYIRDFLPETVRFIVDYKFFTSLIIVLILSVIYKKKFIYKALYLIFFPFLLIGLFIPILIYKFGSWFWVITYFNSLVNYFRSFRKNITRSLSFAIGFCMILYSSNEYVIYLGIAILVFYLIENYFSRLKGCLAPLSIFSINSNNLSKVFGSKYVQSMLSVESFQKLEDSTSKDAKSDKKSEIYYTKSMIKHLDSIIFYHKALLFGASALYRLQKSRLYILFFVASFVLSFAMSVFCLTLINYGVYKIHPQWYETVTNVGMFDFLYYSFNSIFVNYIDIITPNNTVSRIIFMSSGAINLLLLVVFISIFFTTHSEIYKDGITEMTNSLDQELSKIVEKLNEEYSLSVDDARKLLKDESGTMTKLLEAGNENRK